MDRRHCELRVKFCEVSGVENISQLTLSIENEFRCPAWIQYIPLSALQLAKGGPEGLVFEDQDYLPRFSWLLLKS